MVGVAVVGELGRLTRSQMLRFLDICLDKYNRAVIEPGTHAAFVFSLFVCGIFFLALIQYRVWSVSSVNYMITVDNARQQCIRLRSLKFQFGFKHLDGC